MPAAAPPPCPACAAPLPPGAERCPACAHGVAGADEPWGAPEPVRREHFDGLYRGAAEPWTYSGRGAEVLRHDLVARTAASLGPLHRRILDIGCSQGQLTARLAGLAPEVHGVDLSPTAVGRARERCAAAAGPGAPTTFRFAVGGCTALPFAPGAFDLALLCDGLHSWRLSPEDQHRTLLEVERLLAPGGHVILTDHLRVEQFDGFLATVARGPLEIRSVRYLHNRLWFSMARALRPVQDRPLARAVLGSRALARVLGVLARLAGRRGAKHLMVVARRRPAAA